MKTPNRIHGALLLSLFPLLAPCAQAQLQNPPVNRDALRHREDDPGHFESNKRLLPVLPLREPGKPLSNAVLDYEEAIPPRADVLGGYVTLQLKDVSFLSALSAIMDTAPKTCRIECRQVRPMRVSLAVAGRPVAGLLDALAKLGGARLYVLPTKLIIAPETALTEEEKKQAKLYGVLVTAETLPATPDAKALLTTGTKAKEILDSLNTATSTRIDERPLGGFMGFPLMLNRVPGIPGRVLTQMKGPIPLDDLNQHISVNLKDIKRGDLIASLAQLLGCDLYISPNNLFVSTSEGVRSTTFPTLKDRPLVPAFTPESTDFALLTSTAPAN